MQQAAASFPRARVTRLTVWRLHHLDGGHGDSEFVSISPTNCQLNRTKPASDHDKKAQICGRDQERAAERKEQRAPDGAARGARGREAEPACTALLNISWLSSRSGQLEAPPRSPPPLRRGAKETRRKLTRGHVRRPAHLSTYGARTIICSCCGPSSRQPRSPHGVHGVCTPS